MQKGGYIYIMTNSARRPVYIGVAVNVAARVYQHRQGKGSAYCKRYNLTRLVYIEEYSTMIEAIAREKAIKAWKRPWKDELITANNPEWQDLWGSLNG